jgi:hypothetical protein
MISDKIENKKKVDGLIGRDIIFFPHQLFRFRRVVKEKFEILLCANTITVETQWPIMESSLSQSHI